MSQEVAHCLAQLKLLSGQERPMVQSVGHVLHSSCALALQQFQDLLSSSEAWPCQPGKSRSVASSGFSGPFPEPLGAYSSNRGFHMPGSPSWSFRQACCRADTWWCCHRRAGHCIHNLQWACHTKTSLPPNLFGKSMRLLFMPWLIPPTTDKAVAIQFLGDAYFHQITLIFVMSTAPCSPTCWYLKSWFFKLVFGMFWQN